MKNYYDILGVKTTASNEDIKNAYRQLSLKFHPDKNNGDSFFEDMFKNINEAYQTLSDEIKKDIYDQKMNFKLTDKNIIDIDPLIYEAIAVILIHKQASISFLQRKLKLGYSRSSRLIEQIEELNIISKTPNSDVKNILTDKFGVIKILETSNISSKNFIELFDILSKKESVTNSPQKKSKVKSKWDIVKKWRKVSNVFWILNLLLISFAILDSYTSIFDSSIPSKNKISNTGYIIPYKGLNMRESPSDNSNIILTIPYNENVSILDMNGPSETINGTTENWYKVDYNNSIGWVWGGFVQHKN